MIKQARWASTRERWASTGGRSLRYNDAVAAAKLKRITEFNADEYMHGIYDSDPMIMSLETIFQKHAHNHEEEYTRRLQEEDRRLQEEDRRRNEENRRRAEEAVSNPVMTDLDLAGNEYRRILDEIEEMSGRSDYDPEELDALQAQARILQARLYPPAEPVDAAGAVLYISEDTSLAKIIKDSMPDDCVEECTICYEAGLYQPSNTACCRLKCGHSFHLVCLTRYIRTGEYRCPFCRTQFTLDLQARRNQLMESDVF